MENARPHERRLAAFDPHQHRRTLLPLLRELEALIAGEAEHAPAPAAIDRVLRRHPKSGSGVFSRAELIAGLRTLGADAGVKLRESVFVSALRMRRVRTQSGVTPVTVLTKPYPCPGTCVFCPNDLRMPKSYLSREPGAQRAEQNGFDPYLQTYNRLVALRAMGHPLDKVELIVLGGTFSHYPEPYQRWFVLRCLEACNDLGAGRDRRARAGTAAVDHTSLRVLDGRATALSYNWELSTFLHQRHGALSHRDEDASWEDLERAQRENEASALRNVGLSVETRPDQVSELEVLHLRRLGCTKVQLGYQSLRDAVLARNQRGHDVAASRRATRLLRAAGFKLQAHFMLNLLGSTPEEDVADYLLLFSDPDFRPDELKLYPCSLVPSAELMRFYEAGEYEPYRDAELSFVLQEALLATPRYCRLSRVVRDISSEDIAAGNRRANFREVAEQALAARGLRPVEIRSREIKHDSFERRRLGLHVTSYDTSVGREEFLELVTPEDKLVAFLRLCLPSGASFVEEISGHALIRELHVYGSSLGLGARDASAPQHQGFGRELLRHAAERAKQAGFQRIAVISAIGTRPYYRALGFEDGRLYQSRALA